MTTVTEPCVFESRFGFHPCDAQTFRKLKKLKKFVYMALRMNAQWKRWDRKQPQNRFQMQTIRKDGRKIGRIRALDANGQPIPIPEPKRLEIPLGQPAILLDFENARRPRATKEEVKPLILHLDDIDAAIAHVEAQL